MKTAFQFPGQGSQAVGMGKSLAENFAEARQTFEEANDALGFDLTQLCWEGPEERLKLTENAQPAILTVSAAAWRVLQARGLRADYVAGHSLGEYSALVAAGALQFADAVKLVRNRGRYMQEAVPEGVGAMAALLRLPEGKLDAILTEAAEGELVSAANFNSPDQIVIAGHAGAVARAVELAKAAGARKAVMLAVSAPFHCGLMQPAKERLAPDLAAAAIQTPAVPIVNNWEAREVRDAEGARKGLVEQVTRPVLWTQSVRRLGELGVARFIECGPGGVLTGLLRQILPGAEGFKAGEATDLEKLPPR